MKNTLSFAKDSLDRAAKGNPLDLAEISTKLFDNWKNHKDYYPFQVELIKSGPDEYVKFTFANDWTDETFKAEVNSDLRDYLNCVKNITQAFMNQFISNYFNIDDYIKSECDDDSLIADLKSRERDYKSDKTVEFK